VLHGGTEPPQRGGGDKVLNFGTPWYSGMAEARDLKFFVRIERRGP